MIKFITVVSILQNIHVKSFIFNSMVMRKNTTIIEAKNFVGNNFEANQNSSVNLSDQ